MADAWRVMLLLATLSSFYMFTIADEGSASFFGDISLSAASACFGSNSTQFPENGFWAAASDGANGAPVDLFQNGKACGKFYKVTCTGLTMETPGAGCTGRTIHVKIVDKCPFGCGTTFGRFGNQFDLSIAAYQALVSNTDAGIIKISFELDY